MGENVGHAEWLCASVCVTELAVTPHTDDYWLKEMGLSCDHPLNDGSQS